MTYHASPTHAEAEDRLLSLADVCQMTALSRSSIYRAVENGVFPIPVKVGHRVNGWLLSEVQDWIRSRPRRKAGGEG